MDNNQPTSFSQGLEELEKLTQEFENGELDLEKGIPKFKRGMDLVRFLKSKLSEMKNEVEEIKNQFRDIEDAPNPSNNNVEVANEVVSSQISKDTIPF